MKKTILKVLALFYLNLLFQCSENESLVKRAARFSCEFMSPFTSEKKKILDKLSKNNKLSFKDSSKIWLQYSSQVLQCGKQLEAKFGLRESDIELLYSYMKQMCNEVYEFEFKRGHDDRLNLK